MKLKLKKNRFEALMRNCHCDVNELNRRLREHFHDRTYYKNRAFLQDKIDKMSMEHHLFCQIYCVLHIFIGTTGMFVRTKRADWRDMVVYGAKAQKLDKKITSYIKLYEQRAIKKLLNRANIYLSTYIDGDGGADRTPDSADAQDGEGGG